MGHQPSDSHPVGFSEGALTIEGLQAPGEGFPPEGAPFPRTGGRQQREIGALQQLACRAADRTPSCSLSLASPAEHMAIPASVSREQGRHFYSRDEAAS